MSVAGAVSSSTPTALATRPAARRSLGRDLSFSSLPTRSARDSSREDIRTSRRSRASSTVAVSRCCTVASSVAVFRDSSKSRKVGAFEPIPYRASPASRAVGITDVDTRWAPRSWTSFTR